MCPKAQKRFRGLGCSVLLQPSPPSLTPQGVRVCCFRIPTVVGGGSACFGVLCSGGFCGCTNKTRFLYFNKALCFWLFDQRLGLASRPLARSRTQPQASEICFLGGLELGFALALCSWGGRRVADLGVPVAGSGVGGRFPAEGPRAAPQPRWVPAQGCLSPAPTVCRRQSCAWRSCSCWQDKGCFCEERQAV